MARGRISDVEAWRLDVQRRLVRLEVLVSIVLALEGVRLGVPFLAALGFR